MAIKFGVLVPQGWRMDLVDIQDPIEKYEAMTRVAKEAEQLGFDSVWLYDHFHTVPSPELETTFECWISTAALARDTSNIRIGQMVSCNGYRNPALLAKMASTVDVLSHGRLDFGIGAGWYEHEYLAYGYPYPEAPERLRMLGEALQIFHAMWKEDYATFEGKHYQVKGAINEPKGVQQPHIPIWVGGGGEKVTLKLVARYADACNVGGINPDNYRHKFEVLRQHCENEGRDYNSIIKSAEITLNILEPGEDPEEATRVIRERDSKARNRDITLEEYSRGNFVGSAQECVDMLGTLVDAGVEYIIAYLPNIVHLEPLHRLAEGVLPAFRGR
ncbi:MAG: LLM class F420-dependent oxidoreductase [Chloroflexota bacterium]|nr:LLM class F420-dependent oxidoreductase [Chloroflexota bacterium]